MPKKQVLFLIIILTLLVQSWTNAQDKVLLDPTVITGKLERTTIPLRDFVEPPFDGIITKKNKIGYHPKDDWPLNPRTNPNPEPQGWDKSWQSKYADPAPPTKALNQSFDGIGFTNVNPPDPCVDISSTHVIQMINGSGGSLFQIWDKSGAVLQGSTNFDSFTGIGGSGDPIVLYDQAADRWLMSEFASSGNVLVVAITQTNDPMGSWFVYSYNTPNFPDYPKYAIWNNAYIVTTNENSPSVYALDRTSMLTGSAGTAQSFTVASFSPIGFQALSPVDWDGNTAPPVNNTAYVMRMADDAWTGITTDQLELWEFDIDFANPNNTTLTQAFTLDTPNSYDSELCGFTSFACIEQPGTNLTLDPLREVLMNRIQYRNFGTHEAIVCCHVTDVDGADRAGVRWYELRRVGAGNPWAIHQEGTYSPDTDSRWMASIAINEEGSIGLAYSVSSATTFPSLRYTGRKECDPLNTMTEPETVIVAGTASNNSNRYGDYASMSVDPADGSFWFTGQYNPSASWSTRVANFEIIDNCIPMPPVASFSADPSSVDLCPGDTPTITFTDTSTETPTSWAWTFSGAGVSPTSSTSENPTVTVSSGGTVTATLMATNAIGNDMATQNITVTNLSASDPACNPPVAAFAPANGASFDVCSNVSIDFVDNSVGNPSAWSWVFSGAGVSPTTSTSQNPSVSVSAAGTLTAELTVTNAVGTDVLTHTYPVIASCLCNTAGTSIPDNDPAGLDSDLIEGTGGTITDVNIELDITHTFIADLVISLTFNGTTIVLGDPANDCDENNIVGVVFDDESTNGTFSSNGCSGGNNASPAYSGDFEPENPLSVFDGMDKAGTWTLSVVDGAGLDVGTLDSWCLVIESTSSCPPAYTVSGDENGTGAGSGGLNTNGDYETDGSIVSTQTITGGVVDYDSAMDITLNPDFEVVLGAVFTAFIDGCNGTGGEINPLIGTGESEMRTAKKQVIDVDKKNELISTDEKK